VVFECHLAGLLLKSGTSRAVGDPAQLGWTVPRPEARQAKVI